MKKPQERGAEIRKREWKASSSGFKHPVFSCLKLKKHEKHVRTVYQEVEKNQVRRGAPVTLVFETGVEAIGYRGESLPHSAQPWDTPLAANFRPREEGRG
jgi:hypothetical protein